MLLFLLPKRQCLVNPYWLFMVNGRRNWLRKGIAGGVKTAAIFGRFVSSLIRLFCEVPSTKGASGGTVVDISSFEANYAQFVRAVPCEEHPFLEKTA